MTDLPPAALRVRLADDVLVRDGGHLLAGGTPFRLTRVTDAGARLVAQWQGGAPVGPGAARADLARRLLDGDLLIPDPLPRAHLDDVAVVIPVRDQPEQLARCLAAIAATAPGVKVVVVDDGSASPVPGALRNDHSLGPASARNRGLAATDHRLVAFVDADVVVQAGWLHRLAAHFDDPTVGAVAPRVLALDDRGWIAGYEARHSSLDMGPTPGAAGPGRFISYVPSTTLVVRRDALPPGGFDEALHVGEDVDFVWRMHAGRWRVRYDPGAFVRHGHRVEPGAFLRRRWQYAASIGALSHRHPDALPAMRTDPLIALSTGLLAARRPAASLALLAVRLVRIRQAVSAHTDRPTTLAATLTARTAVGAARGWSHAVRRAWAPLMLAAGVRRSTARFVGFALIVRMLEPTGPRRLGDLALGCIDDAVATAGTWSGCLKSRTATPLTISLRSGTRRRGAPEE